MAWWRRVPFRKRTPTPRPSPPNKRTQLQLNPVRGCVLGPGGGAACFHISSADSLPCATRHSGDAKRIRPASQGDRPAQRDLPAATGNGCRGRGGRGVVGGGGAAGLGRRRAATGPPPRRRRHRAPTAAALPGMPYPPPSLAALRRYRVLLLLSSSRFGFRCWS